MPDSDAPAAIKRISILGAGWLGLPLGEALVKKGYEVRGSTTRKERLDALSRTGMHAHELHVGDTVRGENLEGFFEGDLLILNIPPGRRNENVESYHPEQIRQVMRQVREGNMRYLLFVSSTGVYGNSGNVVTEDDPPSPDRPSGKALVEVEKYLRRQKGINLTVLRPAGLLGGERKAGAWLAGKKEIPGGNRRVNLVHLDDCIGVILAIIEQGAWGETFNLCADAHPTRREFYSAMALKEGFEAPRFADDGSSRSKIIANDKVKQRLGYRFQYPDPMEI